jgi:hypothetical protein
VHLRVHLICISLAKKVDALAVDRSINVANAFNVDSCFFCASPMHSTQNCPSSPAFVECSMEQVNAFNDFLESNPADLIRRLTIQGGGCNDLGKNASHICAITPKGLINLKLP